MTKDLEEKEENTNRKWRLFDADGQVLGRLATEITTCLRGKYKPTYVPYKDDGDVVVVINTDKIRVTGNKETKKLYRWHSWFPGGLKEKKFSEVMEKDSRTVIEQAVYGMIPHNRLRSKIMARLKLYPGPEHNHTSAPFEPLSK